MTPVGKIYKPALRLIATRRAIEAALAGAGLMQEAFEIVASEAEFLVHVGTAECREAAGHALVGMPIRYDVRVSTKIQPKVPPENLQSKSGNAMNRGIES